MYQTCTVTGTITNPVTGLPAVGKVIVAPSFSPIVDVSAGGAVFPNASEKFTLVDGVIPTITLPYQADANLNPKNFTYRMVFDLVGMSLDPIDFVFPSVGAFDLNQLIPSNPDYEFIQVVGPEGPEGPAGPASTVPGPPGPANTLTIGTVTSDVVPSASITGASPNQTLNLVLAKGDKGDKGDTGAPGSGNVNTVNGKTGPDVVLVPGDLGAAPTAHTHTKSNITDLGTIGTAAALNVPATGDAAAGEVVKGNDSRMTNPRTPTAHTHVKANITDFAHTHVATTDLTATGTKNNTTFLRGDDTWATPPASTTDISGKMDTTLGGNEVKWNIGNKSGIANMDLTVGSVFTIVPTGALTLQPINAPVSGRVATVTAILTFGANIYTVSLPSGGVWMGAAPTAVANKTMMVNMLTHDGGITWFCSAANQV